MSIGNRRGKFSQRHPRLPQRHAHARHLARLFRRHHEKPASTWLRRFVFPRHPGFPVLPLECKQESPKKNAIHQQELSLAARPKGEPSRTWIVPVCRARPVPAGRRRARSPRRRTARCCLSGVERLVPVPLDDVFNPLATRRARVLHRRLHAPVLEVLLRYGKETLPGGASGAPPLRAPLPRERQARPPTARRAAHVITPPPVRRARRAHMAVGF